MLLIQVLSASPPDYNLLLLPSASLVAGSGDGVASDASTRSAALTRSDGRSPMFWGSTSSGRDSVGMVKGSTLGLPN